MGSLCETLPYLVRNQTKTNHSLSSLLSYKTFLSTGGIGKIWLKEKDEELIIPQGLRERDFKLMPSREIKKPGPVFGTNAGKQPFLFQLLNRKALISRFFFMVSFNFFFLCLLIKEIGAEPISKEQYNFKLEREK